MKRLTQDVFNQFSASSSKGLGLSAVFSKGFAAASVYGRALWGGIMKFNYVRVALVGCQIEFRSIRLFYIIMIQCRYIFLLRGAQSSPAASLTAAGISVALLHSMAYPGDIPFFSQCRAHGPARTDASSNWSFSAVLKLRCRKSVAAFPQ